MRKSKSAVGDLKGKTERHDVCSSIYNSSVEHTVFPHQIVLVFNLLHNSLTCIDHVIHLEAAFICMCQCSTVLHKCLLYHMLQHN